MPDSDDDDSGRAPPRVPVGSTQPQCGLCLSCGAPFMPTAVLGTAFGDSCMIYLHQDYALDPHVRDSVTEQISIKLLGKKHNAHLVHQAAHSVAVGFACYKLRPYEDVVAPGDGQPADDTHAPLHALGGRPIQLRGPGNDRPFGARDKVMSAWSRPPPQSDRVLELYNRVRESPLRPGEEEEGGPLTFLPIREDGTSDPAHNYVALCDACNLGATSQAEFQSTLHELVPQNLYQLYPAQGPTYPVLMEAFGHWTQEGADPRNCRNLTTELAVFLHSCVEQNWVRDDDISDEVYDRRHHLLVHLYWIALQVLCLAEKAYAPLRAVKKSKHRRIYVGLADLYISLFLWLYARWESGAAFGEVSFVQWHQKYMWVCVECRPLFAGVGRNLRSLLEYVLPPLDGASVHAKLETCVTGLLALHGRLGPLFDMLSEDFFPGHAVDLVRAVHAFFLSKGEMLELVDVCTGRCMELSFDSYLREMGVSATCHHLIRTMDQTSAKYTQKLHDFFRTVQETEIQNVVRSGYARSDGVGMSKKHAELLYLLCYLQNDERDRLLDALQQDNARVQVRDPARKCFWAAVLELRRIGALGVA